MASRFTDRRYIIQAVFIGVAVIWGMRLLWLQVIDKSYQLQADSNVLERTVIYPSRGLILGQKDKALVDNQVTYDVMVTYAKVQKDMDTARFCELLDIDKPTFVKSLHRDFKADKRVSPQVPFPFLKSIPPSLYTRLKESLSDFPGFFVQSRTVRTYPDSLAAHLIGYMSEVTEEQVKEMKGSYLRGDYIGMTGMERSYEKELRGKPGIKYILRDNMGRKQGAYENGAHDSVAVAGKDLLTSIDVDLQREAEKLIFNKRGAVVAVDPRNGEILCMASGPTYDPNILSVTNRDRNRNIAGLYADVNKTMINRTMNARYPPGSTFKTGIGAIEIQMGWDPNRGVGCGGGYRLSARHRVGCHRHASAPSVSRAVQYSCNTYFCSSFYHTCNSFGPDQVPRGFDSIVSNLHDYGFGRKLGIDLPGEIKGNIPSSKDYNRLLGKGAWNANTIVSFGIGQGEVLVTPVQMANLAQTIANRGWFYVPHVVKGFRFNGKDLPADKKYTIKHKMRIDPHNFDYIEQGMFDMANGSKVKIPGIDFCGKTGTAQNPQGKDNSAFICFAPRDTPKIAIAVYIENAGFGAQFAAPIASMLLEKYLTGFIKRKAMYDKMRKTRLIKIVPPPPSIADSIMRATQEQQRAQAILIKEKIAQTTGAQQTIAPAPAIKQPASGQGNSTNTPTKIPANVPTQPPLPPPPSAATGAAKDKVGPPKPPAVE